MAADIATESPGLGRRLARNVLWNFGGQLWALALAFFTMPYMVGKLGTDAYGLLMTVGIVTNYLWFMDLGLGQATVKYVAEHAARNEWDEVNRILWTSVVSYLVLGSLAALVLVTIAPLCVTSWFQIPVELQDEALSVFDLSAIGFIIGMVNNAPASIAKALQRFDIVNKIAVGVGTTQTLLTIVLLASGYSVSQVVAGNVIVATVSLTLNARIARRLLPRSTLPSWNQSTFRKLVRFGGYTILEDIVNPLLTTWEKVILANQLSATMVSYYMVPFNILTRLLLIPGAVGNALFPLLSGFHGTGLNDKGSEISIRGARYIAIVLLPIVLMMVWFGEEFLTVWMGKEFATHGFPALQILSVAMFVHSLAFTPFNLLRAAGRPEITMFVRLVQLPLYLPLTFIVVQKSGLTGAAGAYLVYRSLDTVLLWVAAVRVGGGSLTRIMHEIPWRTALVSIMLVAVVGVVSQYLKTTHSVTILAMKLGIVLAGTWLVAWFWEINGEERGLLMLQMRSVK